ncbi:caspase-8-like [Littorina saxatilis]|uniref:caspase-8-like n=1 Tax=Littorina saxatilis TaxID=31220 RepID=UPI0038B4EB61
MDFDVRYFENQTCAEMKTRMESIQKDDHSKYDCFVCCISSHGNETGVCGADDHTVNISELQEYVYSTQCRSLAGKPKVFFVDACRGGEGQKGHYLARCVAGAMERNPDRGALITDKRDFLMSFATTPDNVSWSNPEKGSVFFYHLTMLLNRHAKRKPVLKILHMLNEALTKERPRQNLQTAEFSSTLAKELRFYHPYPVRAMATAPGPAFRFHCNHGTNVVLSDNQRKAQYQGSGLFDGIVMSSDPMEADKLYEVQITKKQQGDKWESLYLGVVTSSPDSLTLPGVTWCWESAVAIYSSGFCDRGKENYKDIGTVRGSIAKDLEDLPVGSRAGVSLDDSRHLHLTVNGADQGVVCCRSLPDGPCWAMWELGCVYTEVTSLPVRELE